MGTSTARSTTGAEWLVSGKTPDGTAFEAIYDHPHGEDETAVQDYDRATHTLVAIEVWDAGTRLPASILEALPAPIAAQGALPQAEFLAPLRKRTACAESTPPL